MNSLIWLSGMAPMKPSTGWPFLKAMTAGMDWMPSCPATAGCSSMFIFTSRTLPRASATTFSRAGCNCLQGPHQGAQKSTSTGWFRESWITSAVKLLVVTSLTGGGAAAGEGAGSPGP